MIPHAPNPKPIFLYATLAAVALALIVSTCFHW